MNKHIETSIKKLEFKIHVLSNFDKIVEEFNLIPGHMIKFRVQEYDGDYFIYHDKKTEPIAIKKLNEIIYKKTHTYNNYGYKDTWKFCQFDKTASVYRFSLIEESKYSDSKTTLITLDHTDYIHDLIECIKQYIDDYKNNK